MTCRLVAGAFGLLLVAGCGDARRPTVREGGVESDSLSSARAAGPDFFHSTPQGDPPQEALGQEVRLDTMRLVAPQSWTRNQRRCGFVLAEFSLPRAKGDAADGRLTVTAVGGSVEANLDRWRQQFGGKPEQESREEIEVSGVRVTLVDLAGTYSDQHTGLATTEQGSGYRMLAAIFSVGGHQFIIKGYGPEKTMADHADEFLTLVRSLKSP